MPLTILLALLLAKIRGLRLKPLLRAPALIPVAAAEAVLLVFQAMVFSGNYFFIQYATAVRIGYMLCYLVPVFAYGLYGTALAGSGLVVLGTVMNRFVIAQNGGKMPVFPSLSYLTGYVKPETWGQINDVHILGGPDTKWVIFSDYIDVGWSILSPGDVLIHLFAFLILYQTIRAVNAAPRSARERTAA